MTETAPATPAQARHPYSPIREASGRLVFVSGQLGLLDGALVDAGAAGQTRQAFANLSTKLAAGGLGLEDIVKVTVYLTSMTDRNAVDEVYQASLPEPLPARTCIAVAELPYGARVELDAIATRGARAQR